MVRSQFYIGYFGFWWKVLELLSILYLIFFFSHKWPARLLCSWDSLGKNTGVGCHVLLQGIFLTQGSNLHLLRLWNWQAGSLPLEPPGKQSLNSSLLFVSFPVLLKRILFNVLFNLSFIFHGKVNLNNKVNCYQRASQWLSGKECVCQCRRHQRHRFDPWVGKIP